MLLRQALDLPQRGAVSLVGGGGKSTLLRCLTEELSAAGQNVAALTTTRITRAQGEGLGFLFLGGGPAELTEALSAHGTVCAATLCSDEKLGPPPPDVLRAALDAADWVMAEADGAKRLPVKAPAGHEPVLLPCGLVVAVAGLSALGRPLDAVCHRAERAAALLGVSAADTLTPALLARLLTSPEGQRKGVEDPSGFRILLNQADAAPGLETAKEIKSILPACRVVITALRETCCVKEVL